jgi:hypothetical protein
MQILKKLASILSNKATHNIITSLDQLPALTRSWLAPLDTEDPELYEKVAKDTVIDLTEREPYLDSVLPAGHEDVRRVLRTINLAGKQIGEFYFAPAPSAGPTVEEQLAAYNENFKANFTVEGDGAVLGTFGENWVVATTGDLALMKGNGRGSENYGMTLLPLARDFGSFVLAQANAYDAFCRFIAKSKDIKGYRKAQRACAAHPAFRDTNLPLIFECQLKG